jgi:hypothetical protein
MKDHQTELDAGKATQQDFEDKKVELERILNEIEQKKKFFEKQVEKEIEQKKK